MKIQTIDSVQQADALFQKSVENPENHYIIFKNSTRCGTSRMAMNMFSSGYTLPDPVYIVQVVESRQASNRFSELLHVRHESPQLLIIRNGKAVFHRSHHEIDPVEVMKIIKSEPAS
jgi:bacillithiol system protein YtxJ